MVDILIMSATGKFRYGVDIKDRGILAFVMNEQGLTNKLGGKLNANALYQVIHRIKENGLLSEFTPDWSDFSSPDAENYKYEKFVNMNSDATKKEKKQKKREECLVCGGDLYDTRSVPFYGKTLCSSECHEIYRVSKDIKDDRITTQVLFEIEHVTTH